MYLTQLLHRVLQQSPDMPLTVFGDRKRTAAESADRIARLAGALKALRVQRDDRVALLALNSDRYHEYLFAVPWADAAVNPVNIRWSAAEVAFSLQDSGTHVLLVDDEFAPMVPAVREQGAEMTTVIFCGEGRCPDGMLDYEQLIADSEPIADTRRGGDDMLGIFYTGGTTGHPKGVTLTHTNVMANALGILASGSFLTAHGRMLYAAPLFHSAALSTWFGASIAVQTHVALPKFSPVGVAKAIADHQVTDVLLVPTMIQMLVDDPRITEFDLSSLRLIIYGSSPMPEAVLERTKKILPAVSFAQGYGMTEIGPVATMLMPEDHADPVTRRSAGRATPHAEVRIVDANDNEVPRGEIGEIIVRGDGVMPGYWNRPEETAEALRNGWMHTGDMGRMDEAGYVFIVDRLKDMIITGGENVYPAEVENALASHPAVAQVAVIGVPDDRWGERVHGEVVLKTGSCATEEALRDHCHALIAGYKVPRSVEFVAELPMSAAGKVLKRDLRAKYWNPQGAQVH